MALCQVVLANVAASLLRARIVLCLQTLSTLIHLLGVLCASHKSHPKSQSPLRLLTTTSNEFMAAFPSIIFEIENAKTNKIGYSLHLCRASKRNGKLGNEEIEAFDRLAILVGCQNQYNDNFILLPNGQLPINLGRCFMKGSALFSLCDDERGR